MRKLLLSTLVGLMATSALVDVASAQSASPTWNITARKGTAAPAPGTISVNVGALFVGHVGVYSASGNKTATQKYSNYTMQSFTRIFLNMDGQTTNGILYGSAAQFRQNSGTPSNGSSGRTTATIFVNNAGAYIGTAAAGKIGVGSGAIASPASAMTVGYFDGWNDGGWNGDVNGFVNGGANVTYPWYDDSFIYATDKIAYFSPKFAGFDFGVAWEPNYAPVGEGFGSNISSSNSAADAGKRRNTYQAVGRYTGAFGPVGVAVSGSYIGSGVVNYTGAGQRFRGLNLVDGGTEITIAGVTFGGNYMWGDQNGGGISLNPVGGVKSNAYTVGAQYAIGPVVVGASFIDYWSQGDFSAPTKEGQRNEYGLAAGGTYALTPGFGFYLSYLYGERKQSGFNLITNAVGPANNQTRAQVGGLGVYAQW